MIADVLRRSLPPDRPDPTLPPGVPAGVLIPLIDVAEPKVVLTERTHLVHDHKGEISFPGGVRHPEDPDLVTTALRETEEELGIRPADVEILGRLPPTETIVTGYVIAPFVGRLTETPEYRPSTIEIARVLEFEVARLAAVERVVEMTGPLGVFEGIVYELDGHIVWGATGRIVHDFLETLRTGGWA